MDKWLIGKKLQSIRWKSRVWKPYMKDLIPYWKFKDECWHVAVRVREECGESYLSLAKFDDAWQCMIVGQENYRTAYKEFLRVIMLDY